MRASSDMPDHLIAECLAECSVFDPAAFKTLCEAVRSGNAIQCGTLIVDLASDYLAASNRNAEQEPAHSTERLDFARSGRPAMDKCFTER